MVFHLDIVLDFDWGIDLDTCLDNVMVKKLGVALDTQMGLYLGNR
jgi:hypothetical protein